MINRLAPALAVTLLLAACGSAEEDEGSNGKSISMEDAAARAKDSDMNPTPGQYRVTMQLHELDVPGAPKGEMEAMRGRMAGQTHEYCLKQEDVDKGFEEVVRQTKESKDCSYE